MPSPLLGLSADWARAAAALTVRSSRGMAGVSGPGGLLRAEPSGDELGRAEPMSPPAERAVSCTLGVARLLPNGGLLAARRQPYIREGQAAISGKVRVMGFVRKLHAGKTCPQLSMQQGRHDVSF